jgi:hypothetical protein
MNVYVPEVNSGASLCIFDAYNNDITEKYMSNIKNNGLYKAPQEIQEKFLVDYIMYRDDYNEWVGIANSLNVITTRVFQRGDESPVAYETVINPQKIFEVSEN